MRKVTKYSESLAVACVARAVVARMRIESGFGRRQASP